MYTIFLAQKHVICFPKVTIISQGVQRFKGLFATDKTMKKQITIKIYIWNWVQWLTSAILTTQEAEIRRITAQGQLRQRVQETPPTNKSCA
jgi:hypothetical protein